MRKPVSDFKCFNTFVLEIIHQFEYGDFSPQPNIENLIEKFKNLFCKDTAYWRKHDEPTIPGKNWFFIALKSYNLHDNEAIKISFCFDKNKLRLNAYDNVKRFNYAASENRIEMYLSFEEIWVDHGKLYSILIELFENAQKIKPKYQL